MIDLYEELKAVIQKLETEEVPYALCGGLAMAVYGYQRATRDIDILLQPTDFPRVNELAKQLQYRFEGMPMHFSDGKMEIRRITKLDPDTGDPLILDILLVTEATRPAWETRERRQWLEGKIWVTSREGLKLLKSMRSSKQDLADIEKLEELG